MYKNWDKYIKNWNIPAHYQRNKSDEQNIYLLSTGLKITYVTNELKRLSDIVDN